MTAHQSGSDADVDGGDVELLDVWVSLWVWLRGGLGCGAGRGVAVTPGARGCRVVLRARHQVIRRTHIGRVTTAIPEQPWVQKL